MYKLLPMFFYKRQVAKKKKEEEEETYRPAASEDDRYKRHEIYEILSLKQGATKLKGGFKVDH